MRKFILIIYVIILSRPYSAQDYFFEFVEGWRNNFCFEQNGNYNYLGLEVIDGPSDHQYLYNTLNPLGDTVDQITFFNDSTTSTTTRSSAFMAEWLDEENLLVVGTHILTMEPIKEGLW